jgi:hypothetical protein
MERYAQVIFCLSGLELSAGLGFKGTIWLCCGWKRLETAQKGQIFFFQLPKQGLLITNSRTY